MPTEILQRLDHEVDFLIAKTGIDANPEGAIDDRVSVCETAGNAEIAALHIWLTNQISSKQETRPDVFGLKLQQKTMALYRRVFAQSEGEAEPGRVGSDRGLGQNEEVFEMRQPPAQPLEITPAAEMNSSRCSSCATPTAACMSVIFRL